jgi:hypothetical protein
MGTTTSGTLEKIYAFPSMFFTFNKFSHFSSFLLYL